MTPDGLVHRAATGHHTDAHREIFALNRVRRELGDQRRVCGERARDD
jgi:hypothetical protein